MTIDPFATSLHRIGAVRFGDFLLKSGRRSPVYVDLRGLVSHPEVLRSAGEALSEALKGLQFDLVAGLPYAGLPLAVSTGLAGNHPVIYPRKEVKEYGTRKQVEGEFSPGQTAVVIDDVITNGGAKLELIEPLEAAGLLVRDVLVLVDREQGGAAALAERGYRLHSLFTLRELLEALERAGAVDAETCARVRAYLDSDAS